MIYDLAVVGGGINGVGIAADAAGRGLSVLLVEMGDLASGTSSYSSKLVHGGLRYLEQFEFRLVRKSLQEREVLLAKAPHIVWPLRFVLPQGPGGRPWLLLRAGLFLYDRLGSRQRIPGSSAVDLTQDPAGRPLRRDLASGFTYWDCHVDDARLVVLNARAAADKGAAIKTRTRVETMVADGTEWRIALNGVGGRCEVRARALVNAAGPWIQDVATRFGGGQSGVKEPIRLVKGSHIVVPRIAGAQDAYLCQSADGRVVFAIPYEKRFTLIGTTDVPFSGDPSDAEIDEDEQGYLIGLANQYFAQPLARADIVWSFSGVRSLYDGSRSANVSSVSRDYHFELNAEPGRPPLLTVLGGKLTTYRRLAETGLARLAPFIPQMGPAWTANATLPGGDLGEVSLLGFVRRLCRRRPAFDPEYLDRLARCYGARVDNVLGDARRESDLGAALGGGLTEREVCYLKQHEWASEPDDVLWRRTKCGLHMTVDERRLAAEKIAKLL